MQSDDLGDRSVIEAADLRKQPSDCLLVPVLVIGVPLDARVWAVPPSALNHGSRCEERVTRRGGMSIATDVAEEETSTTEAAEFERVAALDDPAWCPRPAPFSGGLNRRPE